ncbi:MULTISPECIES: tetratricopeptide repeat protein [Bradyrhizobium]|uniref:tetratricopeptide repeat protein n=1 Tax=Bradyrhizobium TaxID=374 RepID=UPI001ED9F62E|nr:tetratricopeptide repeat protein [Bradyrhizobium zhengyangense]MCG2645514.1 tetratricopeptide repeat protein [Bradyrhizobium zhengyangense]
MSPVTGVVHVHLIKRQAALTPPKTAAVHHSTYFTDAKPGNLRGYGIFRIPSEALPDHHERPSAAMDQLSLKEVLRKGISLFGEGRHNDAEAFFVAAIGVEPANAAALHHLAIIEHRRRRHGEALALIERAIAAGSDASLFNSRANILVALGRTQDALDSFSEAIAAKAGYGPALKGKGVMLLDGGDPASALNCFREALRNSPGDADLHNLNGKALRSLKRLTEALESFEAACSLRPDFLDALNNCAVVLNEQEKYADAIGYMDRVLATDETIAETHNNRSFALIHLKRHEEALESAARAIELKPNYINALRNKASALVGLSRRDEALLVCQTILSMTADDCDALVLSGMILNDLKRFEEAAAPLDRAVTVRPGMAEAHNSLGNSYRGLGQHTRALVSYGKASALEPMSAAFVNNVATTLLDLGRPAEALELFERASESKPGSAEICNNRGNALAALKRFQDAASWFEKAIELKPTFAAAYNGRGHALFQLGFPELAIRCFEQAASLQPDAPSTLNNLGYGLKMTGRIDDALKRFEAAQMAAPAHPDANFNESLTRLLLGDFERGWAKYEWRWKVDRRDELQAKFSKPRWLGLEDLRDKTILLYSEQGFGDTIQFCRYANLIRARGATVILAVETPLVPLLSTLPHGYEIVDKDGALPDHDFCSPLLSLPLALGTRLSTIPADTPYLTADPDKVERWRARLGQEGKLRIGIVWSGNPLHRLDRDRSFGLEQLLGLLSPDVELVSLQKDISSKDRLVLDQLCIMHFGDELNDFSDTAGLAATLDLVISVDTSIAHLAGAIGQPVWILLPYIPDWRWLLGRDDSPWYPTARLFRQTRPGDWEEVMARVLLALKQRVAERPGGSASSPL